MIRKLSFISAILFSFLPLFSEEIHFSADTMSGTAGSKTDTTLLSGNAFVQTSSMEIKADSIELSGDDFRYITAEGTVSGSITESQMDFDCGKLRYDRKTKIAQLEDSVHLIDKANSVTADAQLIEYNQNSENAIMQIGITLKQKDNVCTASFAIYRKKDQMLEMSGNPKIIQGDDSFRAQEITLNLENQEITLDGRVRGTVTDSKKEQPPQKPDADSKLPDQNIETLENSDSEKLQDSVSETPEITANDSENVDSDKTPEDSGVEDINTNQNTKD